MNKTLVTQKHCEDGEITERKTPDAADDSVEAFYVFLFSTLLIQS